MNWILLFMMLELLTISWSKPIDSTESYSELQVEKEALEMQINLTFALVDEANELNKKLENSIIKNTKILPNELSQKPKEKSNSSQYVTENSTEPIEVLKDATNSSTDNKQKSLAPHPQRIFSTSTITTSAPSENSPNGSKVSSSNEDILKNFTAAPTENENDRNVEVKREVEDSLDITTDINAANAEQVTQQSTLELTPDTIAATTQATFEMLREDVRYFINHSQEILENNTELEQSDITEPTVDYSDAKDFTTLETYLNDLMSASTPEKILIRSLNPVDTFNTIANESTEPFPSSKSEKISTQEKTTTGDQEENSKESSTLKQTVDSLTYQEGAHSGHIGSRGTSGDEVVTISSMIQPITQDADTSTALNEIIEDTENSTDRKSEEIPEQIPTLKRAVDDSSEKARNGETESTTTENDKENMNKVDNFASAKPNLDSIETENKDGTQETITTTLSVLEDLKDNQEHETSSASADFSTTNDNLIGTTLSNFENSDLFSTSENTFEAVIESSSESSPGNTSNGNVNNLNNPTSTSLGNFPEVTTNNFNEDSMTTQTSPESLLNSKENGKSDDENADSGKTLLLESQENKILQNKEAASSKKKTRSDVNNEEEAASPITTQQPEITTIFETVMLNSTEIEVLESQETNKVSEIREGTKESKVYKNTDNEISDKNLTLNENSTATNEITTENYITSSQKVQETSTSDHFEAEETTHAFAKLENISTEKEKISPTTILPSASITLSVKFTTVSPLEETKVSTEKLQEKLQEAVKALANEMKKIAVRETDHGNQEETTTFKTAPTETTTEFVTLLEPLREHTTTIEALADETSTVGFAPDKMDDVTTQKLAEEELNDTITVSEWQSMDSEQIKKSRAVFGTTLPAVTEIDNVENNKVNVNEATTTIENDVKENIVATTTEDCIPEESTNKAETATTEEYIAKATNVATFARVSLEKDVNNISLNTNIAAVTDVPAQNIGTATANETHIESTTIMQPTEPTAKNIISTSSEASLQEPTDTTTFIQPSFEREDNKVTFQTPSAPTQPSFMEEQQQQVEITTEQDAQTASAATSGQTATTINYEEQQTTEAEIYTTTEEEVDEQSTNAAAELEARSLSSSPPKLEYSQSEDGVEVFYGYSKVNHN